MSSVSMFYSLDKMTVNQWFSMLANEMVKEDLEDQPDQTTQQDSGSLVYEVRASDGFMFDETFHDSGIYYMRARPDQVEELRGSVSVRKLSFSELVYLSDIFSTIVNNLIPADEEIKRLVDAGEASRYFVKELNTVSSKGLEDMRERVWIKYFDQGMMAIVRRFFSALANFFRKYNNTQTLDTGIYWPGNSCYYADKVVQQLNRIKAIFIYYAYEASKEILSERLEVSVEELESLQMSDLKKCYSKKVLLLHPDKNPDEPDAAERFNKVNRAWGDFIELRKLKDQFQLQIEDFENDFSDSEEDELGDVFSKEKHNLDNPLTVHQFKHVLSLPAPIIVN